jgi:hypothetical protein
MPLTEALVVSVAVCTRARALQAPAPDLSRRVAAGRRAGRAVVRGPHDVARGQHHQQEGKRALLLPSHVLLCANLNLKLYTRPRDGSPASAADAACLGCVRESARLLPHYLHLANIRCNRQARTLLE